MAKSAIVKKISVTADGILNIEDGSISLEITDGEVVSLEELLSDFNGMPIKLSMNYSEDYE